MRASSSGMAGGHLVGQGLTKRYGPVVALDDVTIEFHPGEIHAVLGENGAGKTTLMEVLAGFVVPERGSVILDGDPLPLGSAHAIRDRGIEMVHQHFTLVPAFTVAENLALANVNRLGRSVDVHELAAPALSLAEQLEWKVDPESRVANLPVGSQQRVEVLKALCRDAKVAIFDEPTAVLSPDEVQDLFRVLRTLRDQGRAIVLIAHKLAEVMSVADRITVLRLGRKVAEVTQEEFDAKQLAHWMVGELPDLGREPGATAGEPLVIATDLHVRGDRGEHAVRGAVFEIRRGEILGFGGVDGNGQVELAEALAGIRDIHSGTLIGASKTAAYIPQDRREDGLALTMSVADNLLFEGHRRTELRKGAFLDLRAISRWVRDLIDRFQIKTTTPETLAQSLSGGNQQKIVVARALDRQPELLIAVNPTRGLDIRATQYVHGQIKKARNAGAAVAMFSTDLDELAAIADRVVFMSAGRIVEGSKAIDLLGGTEGQPW